jgi:RNA polymerase sigma factor (TIGR02999 family)
MPIVYRELRQRAAAHLRREGPNPTLRPTELVHEAYLRLRAQSAGWENREQFFGIASRLMRRILVDRARTRKAAKRDHGIRVTLDESALLASAPAVDLVALDQALEELAKLDPRQERLVELRFFAGLSLPEAARVLEISAATASRDWAVAKAWLYHRMKAESKV